MLTGVPGPGSSPIEASVSLIQPGLTRLIRSFRGSSAAADRTKPLSPELTSAPMALPGIGATNVPPVSTIEPPVLRCSTALRASAIWPSILACMSAVMPSSVSAASAVNGTFAAQQTSASTSDISVNSRSMDVVSLRSTLTVDR